MIPFHFTRLILFVLLSMNKLFDSEQTEERFQKEQFTPDEKDNFRTTNRLQSRTDKRIMYVIENGVITILEKR